MCYYRYSITSYTSLYLTPPLVTPPHTLIRPPPPLSLICPHSLTPTPTLSHSPHSPPPPFPQVIVEEDPVAGIGGIEGLSRLNDGPLKAAASASQATGTAGSTKGMGMGMGGGMGGVRSGNSAVQGITQELLAMEVDDPPLSPARTLPTSPSSPISSLPPHLPFLSSYPLISILFVFDHINLAPIHPPTATLVLCRVTPLTSPCLFRVVLCCVVL